jgi:hypothetical protein
MHPPFGVISGMDDRYGLTRRQCTNQVPWYENPKDVFPLSHLAQARSSVTVRNTSRLTKHLKQKQKLARTKKRKTELLIIGTPNPQSSAHTPTSAGCYAFNIIGIRIPITTLHLGACVPPTTNVPQLPPSSPCTIEESVENHPINK